jgi:hypothetical protein
MRPLRRPARQRGAGLLAALMLLGIVATMALLAFADSAAQERSRHEQTARAMGMIREALIARAAADLNRPGSLPCPDYNGDGIADGSLCTSPYIGWLPWATLDLPDLRDASGARFWYALAAEYRDHSAAGVLNSETYLSHLSVSGSPSASNVVAIIFAPGSPLPAQNRDPASTDAMAMRAQYLDGSNNDGNTAYAAGPATATFNDELLAITRDMLMPVVEQRVARQARKCLENFAAQAGADGRFPFAAPLADLTNFADVSGTYYGRIPKTLVATNAALGTSGWPADDPDPGTGTACFAAGTWWDYWRVLLFYRVASAYAPNVTAPPACGSCLTVNYPGGFVTSVKVVAIVAGRALLSPESPNQNLRPSNNPNMYLETAPPPPFTTSNSAGLTGTPTFGKRPRAVTQGAGNFNDRVECLQETGLAPCN